MFTVLVITHVSFNYFKNSNQYETLILEKLRCICELVYLTPIWIHKLSKQATKFKFLDVQN